VPSRRWWGRRLFTIHTAVALLAGCGGKAPLRTTPAPAPVDLCDGRCTETLDVTFLGVAGFLMRSGPDALLTAPAFTNPGLLRVVLPFTVRSDTALVARRMALVDTAAVASARALLVGHAHYDHLLDVPFVARRFATRATIYGGRTMANILAAAPLDPGRVRAIELFELGDPTRVGHWFPLAGTRLRFMPLLSEHAPNVGGATFAPGRIWHPLRRLPRTAGGYKLGEPYAYLIDVMRPDSTPALRILYQEAAASPELAHLPPFVGTDARPVDLLIVTAGNFDAVPDYPTAYLQRLRPRLTIVAHWEDFFRSPERPLRAIPLLRSRELARRLERDAPGRWITMDPMATLRIRF